MCCSQSNFEAQNSPGPFVQVDTKNDFKMDPDVDVMNDLRHPQGRVNEGQHNLSQPHKELVDMMNGYLRLEKIVNFLQHCIVLGNFCHQTFDYQQEHLMEIAGSFSESGLLLFC